MMSIKMVLLLDHDYREDWRAVAISVAMAKLINKTLPTTELINGVMHLSNVLPLPSTRATQQLSKGISRIDMGLIMAT